MLSELDIDVLLHILDLSGVDEILSLRKTCRHFNTVTRLRSVWHNAFVNQILSRNIPVPILSPSNSNLKYEYGHEHEYEHKDKETKDFSSIELERLTLAAVYRNRAWEGHSSFSLTHFNRIRTDIHMGRIFKLQFLRAGRARRRHRQQGGGGGGLPSRFGLEYEYEYENGSDEGRYLLSAGHSARPSLSIQIWDTTKLNSYNPYSISPAPLVQEWSESGRMIGLAIDDGNGIVHWNTNGQAGGSESGSESDLSGDLIAVSMRQFDIPGEEISFVLSILHFRPPSVTHFADLKVIKSFSLKKPVFVRAMHSNLLAIQARAPNENDTLGHGILKVVDWVKSTNISPVSLDDLGDDSVDVSVELRPSPRGRDQSVLRVSFIHDWVLVFRESSVEMYFIPPQILQATQGSIEPSVSYSWSYTINSIEVNERISHEHQRAEAHCSTCNRTGYLPTSNPDSHLITCHCRYRPLSAAVRFESYFPWPVNLIHHYVFQTQTQARYNSLQEPTSALDMSGASSVPFIPYMFPPVLLDTISSTVKFFGLSVMSIGPYGTLLWTDGEDASVAIDTDTGVDNGNNRSNEGSKERVAGRRLGLPSNCIGSSSDPLLLPVAVTQGNNNNSSITGTDNGDSNIRISNINSSNHPQFDTPASPETPTITFSTHSADGWYSIALNERTGRFAVGNSVGGIEVWKYS